MWRPLSREVHVKITERFKTQIDFNIVGQTGLTWNEMMSFK